LHYFEKHEFKQVHMSICCNQFIDHTTELLVLRLRKLPHGRNGKASQRKAVVGGESSDLWEHALHFVVHELVCFAGENNKLPVANGGFGGNQHCVNSSSSTGQLASRGAQGHWQFVVTEVGASACTTITGHKCGHRNRLLL